MARIWRNWSGSVVCRPRRWLRPSSEEALQTLMSRLDPRDRPVRVVGAGHSSSNVVDAPGTLISLERMSGVIEVDPARHQATVHAATPLSELGRLLYPHDLTLPNYGDVATQTIGGAIGTGTHGSGRMLRNLSDMMVKARMIGADGSVHTIDVRQPQQLQAARVALGSLGIITRITLQLQPHFGVERREYAASVRDALHHYEALMAENRSFDFYWYPRRDDVKLRLVNPTGGGTARITFGRLLERREGYPYDIIPTHSGLQHRFEECEYALPAEQGLACFGEVRQRILKKWRHVVGWRVLVRTVAADEAMLSPCHGRDSVTISLHQNSSLPWRDFFEDIEPIFRAHGGRPHWGKKHSLGSGELSALYPQWRQFGAIRAQFDPEGAFMTSTLRALLGDAHAAR